jgi:predicted amidohydrolase YtcJ
MPRHESYVEAGVSLNAGSDYPVTSHDPWIGMYALMTRRSQADGLVYGPDETLGLEETLYHVGWCGALR